MRRCALAAYTSCVVRSVGASRLGDDEIGAVIDTRDRSGRQGFAGVARDVKPISLLIGRERNGSEQTREKTRLAAKLSTTPPVFAERRCRQSTA